MEITNRDDLRVGDIATFAYNGHEFTGEVWTDPEGLNIGCTIIRFVSGEWTSDLDFVRATREMPPLPTEPGSVILVTECRGTRVGEPVVAWWDDVEAYWLTPTRRFGGMTTHDARDFTEWAPAKVVPA